MRFFLIEKTTKCSCLFKNLKCGPKVFWVLILFGFLGIESGCFHVGVNKQPDCWNEFNFKRIENHLSKGKIREIKRLDQVIKGYKPWGDYAMPYVLFFENNLKAIFKPDRPREHIVTSLRAYKFSLFMGFKFVPPTVIRTINGKTGVVQLWIETLPEEERTKIVKNFPAGLKNDIYAFYFLLGDPDVIMAHILIDKKCNLPALIDNDYSSLTISKYNDDPFELIAGHKTVNKISIKDIKAFPFDKVKHIPASWSSLQVALPEFRLKETVFYWKRKDNKLYYVKWKDSLWVKKNEKHRMHLELLNPQYFSNTLIKKLDSLDYNKLASVPYFKYPYFYVDVDRIVYVDVDRIEVTLHRRDILLNGIRTKEKAVLD